MNPREKKRHDPRGGRGGMVFLEAPCAGIIRIRFEGYDLRPCGHPCCRLQSCGKGASLSSAVRFEKEEGPGVKPQTYLSIGRLGYGSLAQNIAVDGPRPAVALDLECERAWTISLIEYRDKLLPVIFQGEGEEGVLHMEFSVARMRQEGTLPAKAGEICQEGDELVVRFGDLVPVGSKGSIAMAVADTLGAKLASVVEGGNTRHAEEHGVYQMDMAFVFEQGVHAVDIVVVDEVVKGLAAVEAAVAELALESPGNFEVVCVIQTGPEAL